MGTHREGRTSARSRWVVAAPRTVKDRGGRAHDIAQPSTFCLHVYWLCGVWGYVRVAFAPS
jgi:hypothetical protein